MAVNYERYPTAVKCPEDVCYQVKDLKHLAARVVATTLHLSARSCPVDLMDLVESQQQEKWLHFEAKDRTCPSLGGPLKVGEFALFPDCTTRVVPAMFTVDLHRTAPDVLRFLLLCQSQRAVLLDEANLKAACKTRYVAYLELQACDLSVRVLPPLDVALVHFSHMLQSEEYHTFAQSIKPGLEWVPHCSTWVFSGGDGSFHDTVKQATRAWDDSPAFFKRIFSATSKFDVRGATWLAEVSSTDKRAKVAAKKHSIPCGRQAQDPRIQVSALTRRPNDPPPAHTQLGLPRISPTVESRTQVQRLPQVVRDDFDWLRNFLASQNGNTTLVREELDRFVLGYQRYLYLCAKHERRMEWIGFSPTPAIDLIWHTHLLMPASYWRDVGFLFMGKPAMHKLLPPEARTQFVYEKHKSEECKEEFGEELTPDLKAAK